MQNIRDQILKIIENTEEVINVEELEKKLTKKEKLTVKLGIDPTANSIHLGFAVVLRKFRLFQDLGHETFLILGDFTALIGDPSGKNKTRPMLTKEQIQENLKTYIPQLGKIIDLSKTKIVYNSEWLSKMKPEEIIKLTSQYTLAQMLEREDFKNRYRSNEPISLHELLYPLFQAYDSVHLKADIELGGIDQKFNFLVTRYIQEKYNQEPEIAVMMPILEGIDGINKMSKSLNNFIGIDEKPLDMFVKVMSIPDNLIKRYFNLCTSIPSENVDKLFSLYNNPKDIKLILAKEIVSIYHGESKANESYDEFINIYSKRELPSNIPLIKLPKSLIDNDNNINIIDALYLTGLVESKAEAKRLLSHGGIYLNGNKITSKIVKYSDPFILRLGKFNYYSLIKE
ncbi:MAG: tyrosine--tRNA ligase [Candidatus Calescibacterium sp.]|nr:tyrosine--tRNA ligase [Candidatus Calescibacterium sp.]MDW8132478.1 tyrosine--tRNA ligase [Candidatus Calescibacterium sp.]